MAESMKTPIGNAANGVRTDTWPLLPILDGRVSRKQSRELVKTLGGVAMIRSGVLGEWPLTQAPFPGDTTLYVVVKKGVPDPGEGGFTDLYFVPVETAEEWIRHEGATLPRLMVPRDFIAKAQEPSIWTRILDQFNLEAMPDDEGGPWVATFLDLVELQLDVAASLS